ncbi:MAG: hypothetical protein QRY72_03710 [Candidatus Rhabdochlamydia sp.]
MLCKVLIDPTTRAAWVKLHTDTQGKESIEIIEPELIEELTTWGMEIPYYYRTQEMKDKKIFYLKLHELEKDLDLFTTVFKETIYKTRLLRERYYWKDANDYIDAASEKRSIQEAREKREPAYQKLRADLLRQHEEALARGSTLWDDWLADCGLKVTRQQASIPLKQETPIPQSTEPLISPLKSQDHPSTTNSNDLSSTQKTKKIGLKKFSVPLRQAKCPPSSLELRIEQSTEAMKNLYLGKPAAKKSSKKFQIPLRIMDEYPSSLELHIEQSTEALKQLSLKKRVAKTSSKKFQVPLREPKM